MAGYLALQLFNDRRALRRQRIFRDHLDPADIYDNDEFFSKHRFPKQDVVDMTRELVDQELIGSSGRKGELPPFLQVCLTLKFYATGTFQDVCGELVNVSQPTVLYQF